MNYYYDLWNFQGQETPFNILQSPFNSRSFGDLQNNIPANQIDRDFDNNPSLLQEKLQQISQTTGIQHKNQQKSFHNISQDRQVFQTNDAKKTVRHRKKRIIKPSPYHNYQKHLNSTMKQLLCIPTVSSASPIHHEIAVDLWNVFKESTLSTKKILHFVFNEFNQHRITEQQLKEMGFMEIYQRSTREDLAMAKNYLTQLALSQLNEHNIDEYLHARRIKNPVKFTKYLLLFRQELEDRFIKKRFTNRSRKEQIKKVICKDTTK